VWTSGGCAGLQAVPKLESAPASPVPRGQTFLRSKLTGLQDVLLAYVIQFNNRKESCFICVPLGP
jgi:hypothetical protein